VRVDWGPNPSPAHTGPAAAAVLVVHRAHGLGASWIDPHFPSCTCVPRTSHPTHPTLHSPSCACYPALCSYYKLTQQFNEQYKMITIRGAMVPPPANRVCLPFDQSLVAVCHAEGEWHNYETPEAQEQKGGGSGSEPRWRESSGSIPNPLLGCRFQWAQG
jgi:hypothetical protein